MQRIAAVLTGKEMDSCYFELYIESLYQTAKFLNESDDSPGGDPVIPRSAIVRAMIAAVSHVGLSLSGCDSEEAIRAKILSRLQPNPGCQNPSRVEIH